MAWRPNIKKFVGLSKETDFPASKFVGHLKQLEVERLEAMHRKVLEICFPEFQATGRLADHVVSKFHATTVITAKEIFDMTQGRARRYAGGRDLPGGRYYAVCDEMGDDNGTLCFELMSYWDGETGYFVGLTDSGAHAQAVPKGFDPIGDNRPFLMVSFSDIKKVKVDRRRRPQHGEKPFVAYLPITVVDMTCENVLDLRRPLAQVWLINQIKKNTKLREIGFHEILSNLMVPSRGGSSFHQSLGAWLRAHGCAGLVFPSARRDIGVAANNEKIDTSWGWSFVLYHGSPKLAKGRAIEYFHPGITGADIGAKIYRGEKDGLTYWKTVGVSEGEWRRVFYELRRAWGEAPPPGPFFDPYRDARKLDDDSKEYFEPLSPRR